MTRCALSDKFVASRHGIQNFPGTEGIPWVPWNRGVHVGRITSPLRCNPQNDAIPRLQNVLAVLPLQSNHLQREVVRKRYFKKNLHEQSVSECQCYW